MKLKLILFLQIILLNTFAHWSQLDSIPNQIREERFVKINGIEIWVTIKGDTTKPVILFLHGGPGSPLSPYADAIYNKWQKDFTLVQWDQRGTGRTFGYHAPEELTPQYLKENPLTIDQMVTDGIELTQYLKSRFNKQKIMLIGTSWGSILGVEMAMKEPDLFYIYIGHSQMVNPKKGNEYAYQKVYKLAQMDNDRGSLAQLNSIGKPPYDAARSLGELMRIIKKYQLRGADPAPAFWWIPAPEYKNLKDEQNRSDGDDLSFVNFAGDKHLGISAMVSTVDFSNDRLIFKIPVYFIQGEEDIQTPAAITKLYFDKISAPEKKFILLPRSEHGFNQAVIDMQYKIAKQF